MADYGTRRCDWPGMRYQLERGSGAKYLVSWTDCLVRYLLERGFGSKYLVYWTDCLVRYSLANIDNFANIYISQRTQLQGPRVTG